MRFFPKSAVRFSCFRGRKIRQGPKSQLYFQKVLLRAWGCSPDKVQPKLDLGESSYQSPFQYVKGICFEIAHLDRNTIIKTFWNAVYLFKNIDWMFTTWWALWNVWRAQTYFCPSNACIYKRYYSPVRIFFCLLLHYSH